MARTTGRTNGAAAGPAAGGLGDLDALAERARTLARAWGGRARGSTTVGRERALLRLFGVHGLDRTGRPLAGEVVDRYVSGGPGRLGGGVALPFAMALLEYDVSPQQLALDVAHGAIDLALEAELLAEPDRRAVAEAEATRLAGLALERIDANRTARRELLDLLGDDPRPWVGTTVLAPEAGDATAEAVRLARDGVGVLRVEVPVGRELAARLSDAGLEVPEWLPSEAPGGDPGAADRDLAPAGSQRGLATLRRALDEVAAERRSYVRLATSAPALAAPEQAVVAAFERVDLVEGDAMAEIVSGRIDPDRALADHAFAHRLELRAGSLLMIGAGPLVVGPDLASGVPSDPATRGGRALALQLLAAALARDDGLPTEQIVVGALPDWVADERLPATRAVAEVMLRRALFAGHPLWFDEPAAVPERAAAWPFLLAGILPTAGDAALVMRRPVGASARSVVLPTRAATAVAGELRDALRPAVLGEVATAHARAVAAAAASTLDRLADIGWRAVLGDGPARAGSLGGDAIEERTESFDALEAAARRIP